MFMSHTPTFNFETSGPAVIFPGAVHLPGFISLDEQVGLLARCRQLEGAAHRFYTPVLSSGHQMSIRVLCLGLHWDAKRYAYDTHRTDVDGAAVEPIPTDFAALCNRLASRAEVSVVPDICIVNYYSADAKLGLHQDSSEREETLLAGAPVLSISVGAEAAFLIGGFDKGDAAETLTLRSGDGFVFGGPSRLRYHGIKRIYAGTEPAGLDLRGRFNVTFRQYWTDPGMRAARLI